MVDVPIFDGFQLQLTVGGVPLSEVQRGILLPDSKNVYVPDELMVMLIDAVVL